MYLNKIRPVRLRYVLYGIFFLGIVNLCLFYNISSQQKSSDIVLPVSLAPGKPERFKPQFHEEANTTLLASKKIDEALIIVKDYFSNYDVSKYEHKLHLLELSSNISNVTFLWETAAKWVGKDQITPSYSPLLPSIFHGLETSRIFFADVSLKGTQLKVLLTLDGAQKALFKPKWYSREDVIGGSVYAGKDRHNGEIAAFHLSRLLGLNRAPIVTGRILKLKSEILPVASLSLKKTFFVQDNQTCFYGVCLYCRREEPVCSRLRSDELEGSLTLWLPDSWELRKHRHPWQRSYSSAPSTWELYKDYCSVIRSGKTYRDDESRLLDLAETAVFDFLIDNGDRHHYETFSTGPSPRVLLIDNGKSFGNPYADHLDILAPLYQCCRIREKFVSRLVALKDGALSSWLKKLLQSNILAPVLTEDHFKALDRRLKTVLAAILVCFQDNGSEVVLATD